MLANCPCHFFSSLLWVLDQLIHCGSLTSLFSGFLSGCLSPVSKPASSCCSYLCSSVSVSSALRAASNAWLDCLVFPSDIILFPFLSPLLSWSPLVILSAPPLFAFFLLPQSKCHLPFTRLLCSRRLLFIFVNISFKVVQASVRAV